jgi:o-succinylbenzoate synthase
MKAHWKKYTLNFKAPSGTSRGVLKTKDSYFIFLEENDKQGIGECGLLRGLSADDRYDYEDRLDQLCQEITDFTAKEHSIQLLEFPSIQFGLEMALKDLESEDHILFPSSFTNGKSSQAINGLIWMGDLAFMKAQVEKRLKDGFSVLKMKIGAIDFEQEFSILKAIREEYNSSELELRVDANGAFTPSKAIDILKQLADLSIHSIEQPIAKGQWDEMAKLCSKTPVPIALDEELIGIFKPEQREELLRHIKPQYIILKPSFIGGFKGSEHWIELADKYNCNWWVTSALESNIGLSAIAQWNYTLNNPMPSGLGTGSLYTNNFESPLFIKEGTLGYDKSVPWKFEL